MPGEARGYTVMEIRHIVVKVSGSLMDGIEPDYYGRLASALARLQREGYRIAVVVGGGSLARRGIGMLRSLGATQGLQDLAGIAASRFYAQILALALYPNAVLHVPDTLEKVLDTLSGGRIPVVGGFQPGQSTNAVAASIAEAVGGLLVNLLKDVDGIYSGAPGEGRLLRRLCYSDLRRIIEGFEQEPGGYTLFDHVALDIVERSGTRVVFVNGADPTVIVEVARDPLGRGSFMGPCPPP